ncbi:hypothetical protein [Kitasatospora mediocidica]|uniref:hypothetical protein n=1 Tax=Kitasatospora mediocidica TaxID=58352 RepID=UPI000563EB2B|nr:hypothetical protein [Kitasatospora mediocidica]
MSAFTDLTAKFHELVAEAEAAGLRGKAELVAVWHKLVGDEQQLATEATADVHQVEADAAPVVAEAKQDADNLAAEAVADVKGATMPPAAPTA